MVGKKLATIAAMVAALAATACDTWSGVAHQAELLGRPDYECVQQVVAANDTVVAWPSKRTKDGVHIRYEVKATGGIVGMYFEEHWSHDTTRIHHSVGVMNARYPQDHADIERPIIILIEQQLEQSCGLTNLRSSVNERCMEVNCPAIEGESEK